MGSETRNCQNCKASFAIESEDFDFYRKIDVPAPTWCPECRQRRRYAWRNERVLYRRPCDLCGKSSVTIYSPNRPFKIYCPSCWWSDKWDASEYARDFDFSRPFFPQFQELQRAVPRISLLTKNSVNSDYSNHSNNNKNCYLAYCIFDSENIFYSSNLWKKAQDCMDCSMIPEGGILLYECVDSERCYKCQFGVLLRDCTDCFYSYDCRNCSNCFLSFNLRNKQYCILNRQYSKEEYFAKLKEWDLSSYKVRSGLLAEFEKLMQNRALHRFAMIEKSVNSSGSMIFNSKNARHNFDAYNMEEAKYTTLCLTTKDSMDSYHFGFECELIYECHALIHDYDVMFSHLSYDDSHIMYCDGCHNSENLFGCVGVRKSNYCVLNKRYDEKSFSELKARIIAHMKETGEFGEFFPPELSPFGYNETQGQIYMPMSKEEALAAGYLWEDAISGTYGKETMPPGQVPDKIGEIPDSITKEALRCVICTKNYNIVSPEIEFYRKESIPVPRKCPDCRYKNRIAIRTPRKLWRRRCMCNGARTDAEGIRRYKNTAQHAHGNSPCPNEFETSYAPGRPEIVYCEACYAQEIA